MRNRLGNHVHVCFALRALWFVLEIIMAKNENNSHAFIRKMVENIKQTKDAQAPTDPKTNEVTAGRSYLMLAAPTVCAAVPLCYSVPSRNSTPCATWPCTSSCRKAPPTVWNPPKTLCCHPATSPNLTRSVFYEGIPYKCHGKHLLLCLSCSFRWILIYLYFLFSDNLQSSLESCFTIVTNQSDFSWFRISTTQKIISHQR